MRYWHVDYYHYEVLLIRSLDILRARFANAIIDLIINLMNCFTVREHLFSAFIIKQRRCTPFILLVNFVTSHRNQYAIGLSKSRFTKWNLCSKDSNDSFAVDRKSILLLHTDGIMKIHSVWNMISIPIFSVKYFFVSYWQ